MAAWYFEFSRPPIEAVRFHVEKSGQTRKLKWLKEFVVQKPADFKRPNKNIPLCVAIEVVTKSKWKAGHWNYSFDVMRHIDFLLKSIEGIAYDTTAQIVERRIRSVYGEESKIKVWIKKLNYVVDEVQQNENREND